VKTPLNEPERLLVMAATMPRGLAQKPGEGELVGVMDAVGLLDGERDAEGEPVDVRLGVADLERLRVRLCDGMPADAVDVAVLLLDAPGVCVLVPVAVGDERGVVDVLAVSLPVGDGVCEPLAELDGELLAVAPLDSAAVGDALPDGLGVDEGVSATGGIQFQRTVQRVPVGWSNHGEIATRKRADAELSRLGADTSGITTRARSPHCTFSPVTSSMNSPLSSADAMQPNTYGLPATGQPVPTQSMLSTRLVGAGRHVVTTR
jgi:hypothetical protein